MAVRRTELKPIAGTIGPRWTLPADIDEERQRFAQATLDMIEMKAGVTALDVEQVANICYASMRASSYRALAAKALAEGAISRHLLYDKAAQQAETAVRLGIANLGLSPERRASKLSRKAAAKGQHGAGGKWGDLP